MLSSGSPFTRTDMESSAAMIHALSRLECEAPEPGISFQQDKAPKENAVPRSSHFRCEKAAILSNRSRLLSDSYALKVCQYASSDKRLQISVTETNST